MALVLLSGIIKMNEGDNFQQQREEVIMVRLELTEKEASTLIDVLESALSDLVTEAAATENREFRAMLQERKGFIREMLARLGACEVKRSA
jgi:hypothetical protein